MGRGARQLQLLNRRFVVAPGEGPQTEDGGTTAHSPAAIRSAALDVARRNRDETVTPQDQLTALAYFWGTTMNARLMTKLARAD